MKRTISLPGSIFLIMAAVTCTMGALISGFQFDVELWALAGIWMLTAIVLPASSLLLRGKGVLFMIPPFVGLIIWRWQVIAEGAKSVLFYITSEFSKWLYIPVLFKEAHATVYEITAFFMAAGIVLAFFLYIAICLYRNVLLAFLFTAPIIFLTFIIIYNQPDPWYLIGILAVYLTLLIGNALHSSGGGAKRRRIYTALSLTSLLLLAAYVAVPSGLYNRPEQVLSVDATIRRFALQTGLIRYKTGTGWPGMTVDGVWSLNTDRVGIADAGLRTISDRPAMGISVSKAGVYYLRGFSMQRFDGRTWSVNSEEIMHINDSMAMGMPALIAAANNRLNPQNAQPEVYMAIDWINGLSGGKVSSAGPLASYLSGGFAYMPYYSRRGWSEDPYDYILFDPDTSILKLAADLPPDAKPFFLEHLNEQISNSNTYLQIEGPISAELRRIAVTAGIDPSADRAVIADQVAGFISRTGRYTLSPYVTPEGEDFTLYFLKTSQQGYCIHYATAATMMLRALGVPARFTSGFVATVTPQDVGRTVELTDRYAHAWVEVYYDDIGWLFLEVTPPATGSGIPDGRPHAPGVGNTAVLSPDRGGNDYFDDMIPDWLIDQYQRDNEGPDRGRGGAQNDPAEPGRAVLWIAIGAVVVAGAFVTVVVFYRRALRKKIDRCFIQDDTNESVIFIWKYMTRLNRRIKPPQRIESIALKARFSLHRISPEERAEVAGYAAKYAGSLYEDSNPLKRLWLKWGLGVEKAAANPGQ